MCLAATKGRFALRFEKPPTQIELMVTSVRSDKALGALLASLLAVFVAASHFNLASYIKSNPLAYGLLLIWAIGKAIQMGRYHWGRVVVDCVDQVDDVMMRVSSSQTMTRIKSSVSTSSMRLIDFATWRDAGRIAEACFERRSLIITAQAHFLSLQTTADLRLSDIKHLMRFAMDVNRLDFDKKAFLSKLSKPCLEAVDAIDRVVMASRGSKAAISTSPIRENCSVSGDMDALVFTAVVRIFAEWRYIRLVPDGHQRYAVGMGLAKRDLIQNAQKVETAVHSWMNENERSRCSAVGLANGRQVSSLKLSTSGSYVGVQDFSRWFCCAFQLSSPTLRQLLIGEREQNLHPRLPKLADKSGASGLLWIQRQLNYQTTIFYNLSQVPSVFPSSKKAVAAAYHTTYDQYHGFLVKQVFRSSFDAAPDVHEIMSHMGGGFVSSRASSDDEQYAITKVMAPDGNIVCAPPSTNAEVAVAVATVEIKFISVAQPKLMSPLEQLADHVVSEWIKLERFMSQCNGAHADSNPSNNMIVDPSSMSVVNLTNCKEIAKRSEKATLAEEEIPSFIAVMQPILDGIDTMIHQLNMKDPSKC